MWDWHQFQASRDRGKGCKRAILIPIGNHFMENPVVTQVNDGTLTRSQPRSAS